MFREGAECSRYMAAPVGWSPGLTTGELKGHGCSALVPKGQCLDAGEDFPLVSGQSHSHVQQIPEKHKLDDQK